MKKIFFGVRSIDMSKDFPFDSSCQVDADCNLAKLEFTCKQTCPGIWVCWLHFTKYDILKYII